MRYILQCSTNESRGGKEQGTVEEVNGVKKVKSNSTEEVALDVYL